MEQNKSIESSGQQTPATSEHTPKLFEIQVPRHTKWEPVRAAALIRSLYDRLKKDDYVFLQMLGTSSGVTWTIFVQPNVLSQSGLQDVVTGFYPGAAVKPYNLPIPDYPFNRYFAVLGLQANEYFDDLRSVHASGRVDPLTLLAPTMADLRPGELLEYCVVLNEVYTLTQAEIEEYLTISAWDRGYRATGRAYHADVWDVAGDLFGRWITNKRLKEKPVLRLSDGDTNRLIQKMCQPLAATSFFLTLDTPYPDRGEVLTAAVAALETLSAGGRAGLASCHVDHARINSFDDWCERSAATWLSQPLPENNGDAGPIRVSPLTGDELAALWHLPHNGFNPDHIGWGGPLEVAAPREVQQITRGTPVGSNRYGVQETPIRLPYENRTAHTVLVGKTDTGKSSLAHGMIHEDIARGHGVIMVDEHGQLVSDVLQHSIPPHRENDVVVLDLSNMVDGQLYPPPLNPLVLEAGVGKVTAILEQVHPELTSKEMGDTLKMALLLLSSHKGATLLDIERLFRDDVFRGELIRAATNITVQSFWSEYEEMTRNQQASLARPVLRRLRGFYLNEHLLATTCHPDSLDLAQLMAENKIILVSLKTDKRLISTLEQRLIGAALIAQAELAARSGVADRPYTLYVDEAQNYVETALADMLSEIRKFDLGLVLIHQYLKQLQGKTLHALRGNVGTIISFEVGGKDAAELATYVEPAISKQDLLSLGKYRAAVSMRVGDQRPGAFTLETEPPPGHGDSDPRREAYLRKLSVANYTPKPYSEVIQWIHQRYGNDPAPAPTGDDDDFFE